MAVQMQMMFDEIWMVFTRGMFVTSASPRTCWLLTTWRLMAVATMAVCVWLLTPVAAGADEIARGQELAQRLCAVCHLNQGQSDKTGPGTVPGFVAVAKRPGQTLDGIIAWLQSVPPMMPDHHLSQDEMEALAFYILSLREASDTTLLK